MFSYFPPFFLFIWLCVSPCCPESEMHAVMRLGSSTLLHSQHNNAHTCCTPLTPRRHSRGGEWGRNSEGETCKHSAKPHRQCWLSRRITIDIDNGSNKRHKPKYEWRQTFRSFPKIVYNLALFFCFFFAGAENWAHQHLFDIVVFSCSCRRNRRRHIESRLGRMTKFDEWIVSATVECALSLLSYDMEEIEQRKCFRIALNSRIWALARNRK